MEKNNLENEVLEEQFNETFDKITVVSIHDTLEADNDISEIHYGCGEDYAIKICNLFEEKYNKKLNYKMKKGLCYFSF